MNAYKINIYGALSGFALLALLGSQVNSAPARAAGEPENRGQLSASDYKFASAAARGSMMEVNLGKLAGQKSANETVKQFGQHMVEQHGKAGKDLTELATRKGATLPTEATTAQQKEMERLGRLPGPEFDKEYIAAMVKDHKADLKEFKEAAEDVKDPDLKKFAASLVPIIEEHLKMAEGIEVTLKDARVQASK